VLKLVTKGEIKEILIDSLAYGGEGVGKIDGFTVFVPDSVTGDKLKIQITSSKSTYAYGKIIDILQPSEYRSNPICRLSKICGGCQWQHINYDEQLKAKKQIVEELIKKFANINVPVKSVISTNDTLEYRCKVQYPVQQTKISKRFLAGYYKKGTHEIVNIKRCPVQPEIIDKITEYLRQKAKELDLNAYSETKRKGLIRHFVFRYSKSHKNVLLVIVLNDDKVNHRIKQLCIDVKNQYPEIEGVVVNFNRTHINVILSSENELICGKNYLIEDLNGKIFKITAGSFFQTNISAAVKMFDTVHNIIYERVKEPRILDLYSGVGSFAVWIKDIASEIVCVEEYPNAINDANDNVSLNKHIKGANIIIKQGNADIISKELAQNNEKFDIIIVDPPRKGCSKVVLDSIMQMAPGYIVYVSCNPSTLARDISLLDEKFIPEFVQPVDMFCHTYHIESIAVLKKIQ